MYHPYVNKIAKQRINERHRWADAVRLASQVRGERASLISRFGARLSDLLRGIKDRAAPGQKSAHKLPLDSQMPGLAED
jgi:hypothetical protein